MNWREQIAFHVGIGVELRCDTAAFFTRVLCGWCAVCVRHIWGTATMHKLNECANASVISIFPRVYLFQFECVECVAAAFRLFSRNEKRNRKWFLQQFFYSDSSWDGIKVTRWLVDSSMFVGVSLIVLSKFYLKIIAKYSWIYIYSLISVKPKKKILHRYTISQLVKT